MTSLRSPLDRWTTAPEPSVELKFEIQEEMLRRGSDLLRTRHSVILGDSRGVLDRIEPGSIHLVVTSPPYWNLKEYEGEVADAQLGHIDDRREFLDNLNQIWSRCYTALAPGGRLCIVVGDVCRSSASTVGMSSSRCTRTSRSNAKGSVSTRSPRSSGTRSRT